MYFYTKLREDKICNVIRKSNKAFEVVLMTNDGGRTTVRYHLNINTSLFVLVLEVYVQNHLVSSKEIGEKERDALADFWSWLCDMQFKFMELEKSKTTQKIDSLNEQIFVGN